ncbi:Uncharacterised protein [Mycobacteroides abscessus subsp. abscessus]|nr:Uncharacterised protein [Mycobacteroides abscessus subsp. abscessus]
MKSTPSLIPKLMSSASLSVIPGKLTLTPGKFTPFLFFNSPVLSTSHNTSPFALSIDLTCNSIKPSSNKIYEPSSTSLIKFSYVTENFSGVPSTSVMLTVTSEPFSSSISPSFMLCVRISGPFVSSKIATVLPNLLETLRIVSILALCSAWSPCEKFKRATFIPALISFSSISSDSDAGPIVQTILVFLIIISSQYFK